WPWLRLLRLVRPARSGRRLVIQTAKIGDWINSTPVIRGLAPVDVLCDPMNGPLARRDSHIQTVWLMGPRTGLAHKVALALRLFRVGYADVYVLMPNTPNAFVARLACARRTHILETYRTGSAVRLLAAGFRKQPHRREDLTIDSYLRLAGLPLGDAARRKHATFPLFRPAQPCFEPAAGFRVGVSLSAGNRLKTLPMTLWREIFSLLAPYGATVYVFGLDDERPLLEELRARTAHLPVALVDCLGAGRMPLEAVPWHVAQMHLYISSDTGNSYIADSFDVPLVNFAGPCDMREQRPLGERALVVETPGLQPFSFIFSAAYRSTLPPEKLYEIGEEGLRRVAGFIEECYRRSSAAQALGTRR
ncbi:MAG TPA: glycosyltransferase family 9 protein, partial [Burkholderiales bacterium]